MRSIVLIAAALWAAAGPAPKRLRLYFDAQLFSAVVLEAMIPFVGHKSAFYAWIFTLATLAVLAAAFAVVWEALGQYRVVIRWLSIGSTSFLGFLFAALTVWAIYRDYGRFDYYLCFPIAQGICLTAAGISMAITVPLSKGIQRFIASTLSILWVSQAGYKYVFAIYVDRFRTWEVANFWVPTVLVSAALFSLGIKLREHARENRGHKILVHQR